MSEAVKEYFEQTLPKMFNDSVAANPPAGMEGEEMRIVYDIEGEKYGLLVKDGKNLEVVPGGLENPHIHNSMDESSVADVISSVLSLNPLLDYNSKKRLDKIKNLKGNFKLELTRDDGSKFQSSTVFNGVEDPAVKVLAKATDYAQVLSGKLNPQMAFMTGKVKFEGSMPFLMVLGTLNQ